MSPKKETLLDTNPYLKLLFDWKLQLIKLQPGSSEYELLFNCIGELGSLIFDKKDYWQASFEALNQLESNKQAVDKELSEWK